MKDYLWIIVAGTCAILAFLFFILTITNSTSLIQRLKKSKLHIITNIAVLLIGLGNIGMVIYLLLDLREQINFFSMIHYL
ncbi:hypothetical protein DOK76_05290 [Vagococcus sp. DIV0080]|uniref:Uncharacterized protein n=1 Tax=Candidatus Vagococcus giribetii TaxID=2230876 RepID=A0ABS3HRX3_9ENTE|nr:hypothetical protein [Vagococcus sp. DIV0080]MBO0476475.1 hypothetical protein [Vagococcus sp. DIV0080]